MTAPSCGASATAGVPHPPFDTWQRPTRCVLPIDNRHRLTANRRCLAVYRPKITVNRQTGTYPKKASLAQETAVHSHDSGRGGGGLRDESVLRWGTSLFSFARILPHFFRRVDICSTACAIVFAEGVSRWMGN